MNRPYGWIFPSRQLLCRLKRFSEPLAKIPAVRNYSAPSESFGQLRTKYRHEIRTFRADRLASVEQPILNLSAVRQPQLRILDEVLPKSFDAKNVNIVAAYARHSPAEFTAFPAGTRGVFYFHHVRGDNVQSQIRFRLCDTLDEFHHGKDLLGLEGNPWKISLKTMARAPGKQYRPALALLQDEFPVDPRNVDPSHNRHRVISTLNPQNLLSSGQQVMDISGMAGPWAYVDENPLPLYYKIVRTGECSAAILRYPLDTIGVFYYKQSLTAPTRLGEVRFRLCPDVQEFAHGKDLLLPSGSPWCIDSLTIHSAQKYQELRHFLIKEGLLEDSLHLGTPIALRGNSVMPLRILSDPFEIDLAATTVHIDIASDPLDTAPTMRLDVRNTFRRLNDKTQTLLSGRVIVRLEEYPGLPQDASPNANGPRVAMRFLEMLTPVRRLSDDDYIQFPREGQLLCRRGKTGEYIPWGLSPRKDSKTWMDWVVRSRVA